MALQASDYLVVPRPCDNPRARLVCFPHSGGGPSAFARWQDGMLDEQRIEVVMISAPGRERRIDQAALTDWRALVGEISEALQDSCLVDGVPYAFFGHSLGAILAYETARQLDAVMVAGRPRPVHLFVSAHGAPDSVPAVAGASRDIPNWGRLHTLDDEGLTQAVERFGFLPSELTGDTGLLSAVMPALRADFEVYESYVPDSERQLALPVTALGGAEDAGVSAASLKAWSCETSSGFRGPEVFPGGHFFINDQQAEVLTTVAAHLQDTLDAMPRSVQKSQAQVPDICYQQLIHEAVLKIADRQPDAEALVDEAETITYAELAVRVRLLASTLRVEYLHGRAQQVVALLAPHDATYVTCMLAIWQAGGVLLVIEAHFPVGLCKEICEESNTVAAVATPSHAPKFAEVQDCHTLVLQSSWVAFLRAKAHPMEFPRADIQDTCMLMMTSGTTGRPKTIAGSHFFMHLGIHAKNQIIPYADDDNREAFNVMFVWECIRPLVHGLTSFCLPDEAVLDASHFVSHLHKHRISRVLTTPSLLSTIMRYCPQEMKAKLGCMRTWLMCGEVLPMSTVHAFQELLPGCKLVNDYSSWESGDISYATVSPSPSYMPSTIFAAAGQIAPGSIAVIIDPDTLQVLPLGTPGELYLGGPALSHGYYQQPEATAKRFVDGFAPEMHELWQGKWYKSGDCGRLVGSPPVLEIRGRMDSTVKIRGFKIGIPVVEAAIMEVAGVMMCAVVPVYESPAVVDSLLCFIKPVKDEGFDEVVQRVRIEGAKRIPRWMMPPYFRQLPDNCLSGGEAKKLDRKQLTQMADLQELRRSQTTASTETGEPGSTSGESDDSGVRGIVRAVWAKALNLNVHALDLEENFFDLGGHSALAAQIASELSQEYGLSISVLDIYSNSTLGALLNFIDANGAEETAIEKLDVRRLRGPMSTTGAPAISIVGIAGRFPGARDVDAFWANLRQGTVSATFLSKDFLRGKGVSEDALENKDFVPVAYMIEDADKFDHQFFGIGRHEASLMDPQHRVFIEASWAALENAALPPKGGLADTVVGVFAAAGIDGYLVHHLDGRPLKDTLDPQDIFLAEIGNEKDYIATRVAYLMDFTGPAMNVNSACSSALVACAQGAAAIMAGQCDAAVAGASSITFPNLGYLYQDGLVSSMDGYVRPFDAAADGTVFGDSVASLILRRTDDVKAGLVWGSMKGFAVTNDGGQKAGYAAPSPMGQSNAVVGALRMMNDDPWSISYVEAHCTGTRVGDGIEARGLMDAFARIGGKKGSDEVQVALGSVKGNIAHANCAAGATGFIKTLMMLKSRELVPVANFTMLNPKINFSGTPFQVNNELCAWDFGKKTLRAGVSSFGIGGTNAHVILEQPPLPEEPKADAPVARWAYQVVPLSAKSPLALKQNAERLSSALRKPSEGVPSMASTAFTLQTGRSALPLRQALVVSSGHALDPEGIISRDLSQVANVLDKRFPDIEDLEELPDATKRPSVAFVFPGQGSQHLGMARGLYEQVPLFREAADRCCALLAEEKHLGFDLRPCLFSHGGGQEREKEFARPSVLQPSLFVVEYALTQVLLAVGITPIATAGHSLGEYCAAVVGGLLTLESAVAIVASRAKSTETLAEDGAMLSVSEWSEQELAAISEGERPGLWLAAVNSPLHAVISGEVSAIDELEAQLKAAGRKCAKLHVRKAFHSGLIANAAETLKGLGMPAEGTEGSSPLPVASNFTGGWLSAAQLRDGKYWTSHMRGTVLWRQNADKLVAQWQPAAILEVGPGNTLSSLTAKCVAGSEKPPVLVQAMRHPKADTTHDVEALLSAVARLWELGFSVDWPALHTRVLGVESVPALLRLPTYAFDPISLWENPERSIYVEGTVTDATAALPVKAPGAVPALKSSRTLIRFGGARASEPAIRAYCLPFASGSATVFAPWAAEVDDAIEVIAVELPGRGGLADERIPGNDAEDDKLLEDICEAILADLRGAQFVLVGFSMGGGLSVDIALRLAAKEAPLPLALYVAGRKPPVVDPAQVGDITMSNEELAEYAFAPPEVAQSPEFIEHVVPLLRADLGVDARCERRLSSANVAGQGLPVGVGLEVFCGTDDGVAPWTEAAGWQRFLKTPLGMHYMPGGHEFMQESRPMIRALWRRDAIGRLVQRRSVELAMLSAQSFAAPGSPIAGMPLPGIPAAGAKSDGLVVDKKSPLYAVRWVEAFRGSESMAPTLPPAFFVNLGTELSEAELDAVVLAAQSGNMVITACRPTKGVLSGYGQSLEVETGQCWQYMRVVQKLLAEGLSCRMLVVCPSAVSGAMVAGASKAVAMEASELNIQRIFVPPERLGEAMNFITDICNIAGQHPEETDLWLHDDMLQGPAFVPRLEPIQAPSAKLPCVPRHGLDGSMAVYLLTGATGGLGKAVVEWLISDQGLQPEQLILLRRVGSAPLSGSLATCRVVEVTGPDSREALLDSALKDVRGVAGIFHLAGVLDDGIVGGMTEERVRGVAKPKCGILMALLHAATAFGWPIRWVLGFSSTSSLFGYAGQSNYCAANAMLDQMSTFGAAGTLPEGDRLPCRVLAVNWGPWGEAGMAKVGTKAYQQAVEEGDTPLPTAAALRCLAAALRIATTQANPAATQFAACDVEWQKSQWRDLPILGLITDKQPVPRVREGSSNGSDVGEALKEESLLTKVEDFMVQHTKSGKSWKRIQTKSLHQLGLDSLEVVQIRNLFNKKFGVNVPLGVIADPSRDLGTLSVALAEHLG